LIALAWLLSRPGVVAPLIGARSLAQRETNLSALDVDLIESERDDLDRTSRIDLGFPHEYLQRPTVIRNIYGDMITETRR
jgi:diketogulonate reductase-like aldo/keto reductase